MVNGRYAYYKFFIFNVDYLYFLVLFIKILNNTNFDFF